MGLDHKRSDRRIFTFFFHARDREAEEGGWGQIAIDGRELKSEGPRKQDKNKKGVGETGRRGVWERQRKEGCAGDREKTSCD